MTETSGARATAIQEVQALLARLRSDDEEFDPDSEEFLVALSAAQEALKSAGIKLRVQDEVSGLQRDGGFAVTATVKRTLLADDAVLEAASLVQLGSAEAETAPDSDARRT